MHLVNDIVEIPLNQNLRFASFDIENMYSNVPTNYLINIIKLMCSQKNHDKKIKKELIKITRTILNKSNLNSRIASMFKIMDLQWGPHLFNSSQNLSTISRTHNNIWNANP